MSVGSGDLLGGLDERGSCMKSRTQLWATRVREETKRAVTSDKLDATLGQIVRSPLPIRGFEHLQMAVGEEPLTSAAALPDIACLSFFEIISDGSCLIGAETPNSIDDPNSVRLIHRINPAPS